MEVPTKLSRIKGYVNLRRIKGDGLSSTGSWGSQQQKNLRVSAAEESGVSAAEESGGSQQQKNLGGLSSRRIWGSQ